MQICFGKQKFVFIVTYMYISLCSKWLNSSLILILEKKKSNLQIQCQKEKLNPQPELYRGSSVIGISITVILAIPGFIKKNPSNLIIGTFY